MTHRMTAVPSDNTEVTEDLDADVPRRTHTSTVVAVVSVVAGVDPQPTFTGEPWQTPIIAWTQKQATTEKKPLESLIK